MYFRKLGSEITINFHGMNGKNPLFNKEENLLARSITEDFFQNVILTKNIEPKHYQKSFDNFLKSNEFFSEKLTERKIDDAAFYFTSSKAYENYKKDRDLLSTVSKKDINFLKKYKSQIENIPHLFSEDQITFDPENQLNLLTLAYYKKEYRSLLDKNIKSADDDSLSYTTLSVENITKNMPSYYKASELGNFLTSESSYFNSEKDLFDNAVSKFINTELLREIRDVEQNKNYSLDNFLRTFKDYTRENPDVSEDSVLVMSTLFNKLTKTQKQNITNELDKNGIKNEKLLRSFLDKENLSLNKEKDDYSIGR